MHQLDTLYQSNGSKNSLGSFGVTGVKRSFSRKNAITRPLYIARPYDSNMYISLRPSTFVMGLKVNLGSFGVTRVKRSFSLKMQYLLCYVVYQCNSCICIRLTPLQNFLAQIWISDHRVKRFFAPKTR